MARRFFIALALLIFLPISLCSGAAAGENDTRKASERPANGKASGLSANPHDVDLGVIGPDEESKGIFYLKNMGPGNLSWSTDGPEGWLQTERQSLTGTTTTGDAPQPLKIQALLENGTGQGKTRIYTLLLRMEYGGQAAVFRRETPLGILRESIRINFPGGTKVISFRVHVAEFAAGSVLEVKPLGIDFGVVRAGEQITKRVLLTNKGRDALKWKAGAARTKGMPASSKLPQGRYISFQNDAVVRTSSYLPPPQLRETLELSGVWGEQGGFPAGQEKSAVRFRFTGTGISLFLWKTPEGGPIGVFLDEQFVNTIDGLSDHRERAEVAVADGQLDGSHILTLVGQGGRIFLEGVRVHGKPVQKGPRGWITVFPNSGTTIRETDYINIVLNTNQLIPGIYGDHVFFVSKSGEAEVEVIVEVAAEAQAKYIDVHKYLAGSDYLYITNPRAEANRLQARGYVYLGTTFRLFSPGTPGTTEFFRWFNPAKGDHFYSHDPVGGGKPLAGYLFEGSIGNIATSRLSGTRELYRWYNRATGRHFYTTDQSGEGLGRKGYVFDGIAGFVR